MQILREEVRALHSNDLKQVRIESDWQWRHIFFSWINLSNQIKHTFLNFWTHMTNFRFCSGWEHVKAELEESVGSMVGGLKARHKGPHVRIVSDRAQLDGQPSWTRGQKYDSTRR